MKTSLAKVSCQPKNKQGQETTLTEHLGGTGPGAWLIISILERRKLRPHSKLLPEGQGTQARAWLQRPAPSSPAEASSMRSQSTRPDWASAPGKARCPLGTRACDKTHSCTPRPRRGETATYTPFTGQRVRGGVGRASYFQANC